MIIIPYLFSFFIGLLLIATLTDDPSALPKSLYTMLALGIGLGVCALTTFIVFLVNGVYNPSMLIGFNGILLAVLLWINRAYVRTALNNLRAFKIPGTKSLVLRILTFVFLAGLLADIYYVAQIHPFGEWDAWGMWNLKMRFLILSQSPFHDIFYELDYHTHPDYPILLSLINVWLYSVVQKGLSFVPMITSLVWTSGCGFLLYGGLRPFMNRMPAFFLSLILLTHTYFLYVGTSQYADVVIAFYLMASFILLFLAIDRKDNSIVRLCGLILGLLAFTKNEGMVMMLIFLFITTGEFLVGRKRNGVITRELMVELLKGLALTVWAVIIFKTFLAPGNSDIVPAMTAEYVKTTKANNLWIIIESVKNELIEKRWGLIWFFVVALIALKLPHFFMKECRVASLFFITYMLIIIGVYAFTKADLKWWLTYSLDRIYFSLFPSILFLCFYIHYGRKKLS